MEGAFEDRITRPLGLRQRRMESVSSSMQSS